MKTKHIKYFAVLFVIVSVGISSSISLLGGIGIETVSEKLIPITPLIIVLPALNSLVGDYATLIAAHAGNPSERTRTKRDLIRAMIPSLSTSILIIIGAGLFLGHRRGFELHTGFVMTFVLFVIASVLSVVTVMFVLTFLLDKLLEDHHLNADDVLIPIITTVSDIFMLSLIALSAVYIF